MVELKTRIKCFLTLMEVRNQAHNFLEGIMLYHTATHHSVFQSAVPGFKTTVLYSWSLAVHHHGAENNSCLITVSTEYYRLKLNAYYWSWKQSDSPTFHCYVVDLQEGYCKTPASGWTGNIPLRTGSCCAWTWYSVSEHSVQLRVAFSWCPILYQLRKG
jgi:hypothetical protein